MYPPYITDGGSEKLTVFLYLSLFLKEITKTINLSVLAFGAVLIFPQNVAICAHYEFMWSKRTIGEVLQMKTDEK